MQECGPKLGNIALLGAGPIGCENVETFQRFGAEVTLLACEPYILPREDEDAAELVEESMRHDRGTGRDRGNGPAS